MRKDLPKGRESERITQVMPELYSQATLQKAKLALLLWKKAENYIEFSDFDDPDF